MMTELEHATRYFLAAIADQVDRAVAVRVREELEQIKAQEGSPERPPETKERYLNQRQAAEYLGCSVSFIRKQRRAGTFPEPTRLSPRDLRWARSELQAWAAAREPSCSETT